MTDSLAHSLARFTQQQKYNMSTLTHSLTHSLTRPLHSLLTGPSHGQVVIIRDLVTQTLLSDDEQATVRFQDVRPPRPPLTTREPAAEGSRKSNESRPWYKPWYGILG